MNRIVQFEWLKFPLLIARRWATLGLVMADGHYLVRWPTVAILSPPIAAALGVYVSTSQQEKTYTYSIGVMAALGIIGQLSAALGFWALVGYTVSNMIRYLATSETASFIGIAAHAISFALLGLLLVLVPVFLSNIRAVVTAKSSHPRIARLIEPIAGATIAGCLVYIWVAVTPLLIRPMFTWPTGSPPVEAIAPLQQHGIILVLILVGAAVARIYIEHYALVGEAATHSQVLREGIAPFLFKEERRGLRSHINSFRSAVLLTIFLSGMISNWVVAITLTLFFFGLLTLRSRARLSNTPFLLKFYRVPVLARLLVGILASVGISRLVVGLLWGSDNSFTPLLVGACLGAAFITLLTVQPDQGHRIAAPRDRR